MIVLKKVGVNVLFISNMKLCSNIEIIWELFIDVYEVLVLG